MQFKLETASKKKAIVTTAFTLAVVYVGISACVLAADWFADHPDPSKLRTAIYLDPSNADYRHRLGRYYDLVVNDPAAAQSQYQQAVSINPHDARYWLDLANTYQLLGDSSAQAGAIERAVGVDPTTPQVAWEAANLYLVRGQTERALAEFRLVMEGAPYLSAQALALCWRISPDVDHLLATVIPPQPSAYLALLSQLMSKEDTAGAVKVWDALIHARQPVQERDVFDFVRYLLFHKAADDARRVWRQAAAVLGLSAYLPSSNNLIVNGSFSLPILNGGFDWQYRKQAGVSLTLDSNESHDGHRSLAIAFDGPGVEDAGIFQPVVVQPDTTYEFTSYYKNEPIEGTGGPHFAVQDLYTSQTYFLSEELRDGAFWKSVVGEFTTGPQTNVLVLRVQRIPPGNAIHGKLWIDDFRLVEKSASEGGL
jgi:tetratricopeptide (TPR) repeat protein